MKNIFLFFLLLLPFCSNAQDIDCDSICVSGITMSPNKGYLDVTVYNGNLEHINYPTVIVIAANGDTIGNPQGSFDLFAQSGRSSITHSISTSLTELPDDFTGTVLVIDQVWDDTCSFSFPMGCSIPQQVDCSHLRVEDVQSGNAMLEVTVSNNCDNCFTGMNGPVYLEMLVIRTVAPFDTIAASNCYCLFTPDENGLFTYTLELMSLPDPAPGEFRVVFLYICDNLTIADPLSAPDINYKSALTVFPNPGSGKIFFNNSEENINSINVFDPAGRLLIESHVISGVADISFLPSGVYFLQLNTKLENRVVRYMKTE